MAADRPYGLVKPCAKCPFRKDVEPYLRKARVREIERSLVRAEFPCHETIGDVETGEKYCEDKAMHCAGALILLEKLHRPSQMMRISERIGMYDASKLDMDAPVFDSFKAMIKAQEK